MPARGARNDVGVQLGGFAQRVLDGLADRGQAGVRFQPLAHRALQALALGAGHLLDHRAGLRAEDVARHGEEVARATRRAVGGAGHIAGAQHLLIVGQAEPEGA